MIILDTTTRSLELKLAGSVTTNQLPFVCAYVDEAKCSRMRLDGSITLSELSARLPSLPRDQEIIFYCA